MHIYTQVMKSNSKFSLLPTNAAMFIASVNLSSWSVPDKTHNRKIAIHAHARTVHVYSKNIGIKVSKLPAIKIFTYDTFTYCFQYE